MQIEKVYNKTLGKTPSKLHQCGNSVIAPQKLHKTNENLMNPMENIFDAKQKHFSDKVPLNSRKIWSSHANSWLWLVLVN